MERNVQSSAMPIAMGLVVRITESALRARPDTMVMFVIRAAVETVPMELVIRGLVNATVPQDSMV